MAPIPWWELPRFAYRPQYLLLASLLQEKHPPLEVRALELALTLALRPEVVAPDPSPG